MRAVESTTMQGQETPRCPVAQQKEWHCTAKHDAFPEITQISSSSEWKPVERNIQLKKTPGTHLGISLCCISRHFYVTQVQKRSIASTIGLDVGDRLEGVNRISLKNTARNGQSIKASFVLEVLRNAEHLNITVYDRFLSSCEVSLYLSKRAITRSSIALGTQHDCADSCEIHRHRFGNLWPGMRCRGCNSAIENDALVDIAADDDPCEGFGLARASFGHVDDCFGCEYAEPPKMDKRNITKKLQSAALKVLVAPWKEAKFASQTVVTPFWAHA